MPYMTIETSKESLRRPCGPRSFQASSSGTKTSSTSCCVACRLERSPADVLREERISIPRRLAASHLDSKEKQEMARALLLSVEDWTVRPKPEFFAHTRPTPLTESVCYSKGFFEHPAKKRNPIARFVQRVNRIGKSDGEKERREDDIALLGKIPTDFQHPHRRLPYTPVGNPLLPAETQWRPRSYSTSVRPRKDSNCIYTTFIFAENTAVHFRRLAAQNALNLRIGGSIHADIIIKDDNFEDAPMYRRRTKMNLPVTRPGCQVQHLGWHRESFRYRWQSNTVCTSQPSSLPIVQSGLRLKKRRIAPQLVLMTAVWRESQIRSALAVEWKWLQSRYLSVKGSDRDVLKPLINHQKRNWRETERKASKAATESVEEHVSPAQTVLGVSNALPVELKIPHLRLAKRFRGLKCCC